MTRRVPLQATIRSLRPVAALLAALWLLVPGAALAQDGAAPSTAEAAAPGAVPQGAFPEATFETYFRKYGPPENIYSPYYSWDAAMALDLTLFRKGSGAVDFGAVFQTAGTENLGTQIGVGGTGYILRAGYVRTISRTVAVSAGIAHLSSHLTRDLDDKTDEQRRKGIVIPDVQDPDEYNVLYLKAHVAFERWPLEPQLDVVLQPVNVRFDFGHAPYARPLYLGTRWALWRRAGKTLALETQHEVGNNGFNSFCLLLELFPKGQRDGRFHVFVGASPGRTLHVSPNVSAIRDGVAAGIRLRFRS